MLKLIYENLRNSKNTAFVINDIPYTYEQTYRLVNNYMSFLKTHSDIESIGIVMHNDLETYAMLIASVLSDTGYVILNPDNPVERNAIVIYDAKLSWIAGSIETDRALLPSSMNFIILKDIQNVALPVPFQEPADDSTAYILFTSGSTGNPKGVRITKKNLKAFLQSFFEIPIEIKKEDHVLQMFDLTFDVSVAMLLLPLIKGATIYTVNSSNIKYLDIARVLTSFPISVACLVPSVVSLLRPFLPEINLPKVRTCILTAEATSNSLLNDLKPSMPNADIWNLYGPTEATVWCLAYLVNEHTDRELYHDLISIGKSMPGIISLIESDKGVVDQPLEKGELLVGGDQIAWGYVNDEAKNRTVFKTLKHEDREMRFYYTGDIAYMNEFGNIMYCGRKDHQVKIQGYRIELNEIEYHARQATNCNAIAIAKEIKGSTQLFLCVENYSGPDESIREYLLGKLPVYMIPKQIIRYKQFPVNSSNKIDRKKLEHAIES